MNSISLSAYRYHACTDFVLVLGDPTRRRILYALLGHISRGRSCPVPWWVKLVPPQSGVEGDTKSLMSMTDSAISSLATSVGRPSSEGERMYCEKRASSSLCRELTAVVSIDSKRATESCSISWLSFRLLEYSEMPVIQVAAQAYPRPALSLTRTQGSSLSARHNCADSKLRNLPHRNI